MGCRPNSDLTVTNLATGIAPRVRIVNTKNLQFSHRIYLCSLCYFQNKIEKVFIIDIFDKEAECFFERRELNFKVLII